MSLDFINKTTLSKLCLSIGQQKLYREVFEDRNEKIYTIAWNRGPAQTVIIDNIEYEFPTNAIVSLMIFQTYSFADPENIVAWRFNREFYCVVDHDQEVSCVGFLFYGNRDIMFVRLSDENLRKQEMLLEVFLEEFSTSDTIQEDMLRMLIKRLIILITRLAKEQYLDMTHFDQDRLDLVRQFNLLVEENFRNQHSVSFYASQLNKSPKTLSNVFALYNKRTPSQIIKERLVTEAKRLLIYTELSIKEIAHELGYDEIAHFSNFFKKNTGFAPGLFRSTVIRKS